MSFKHFLIFTLLTFLNACSDREQSFMEESEPPVVQTTECTSDHPMVGQTGELRTLFHSVSGTATIVDDCTIEITNFNYDGGGIIVEIYAGVDDNYFPPVGFALSQDISGPAFINQTYTVQLPSDKTLDDLNGISVWCSDVGVSFGDSLFN